MILDEIWWGRVPDVIDAYAVPTVKVRTHPTRTCVKIYERNAAKMLLDHFVSKMVLRSYAPR